MTGILYVVATPIGNLEDVTLRALRILREVSVIAAEDTRRTARLLQHYSISTPTTSLHEHNERQKTNGLVARLAAGEAVALVSDAGTPGISDPGRILIEAARQAGIRVEPVPGPSAVMAAISAAGLPAGEFCFMGFPPHRSKTRTLWFERLTAESRLVVFFEAPHRVLGTLTYLSRLIGSDELIAMGRELTKLHEELVVSPIKTAIARLESPRGEFTILVPPRVKPVSVDALPPDPATLQQQLDDLTQKTAMKRRDALRTLGQRYGLSANELYKLLGS